MLHSTTSNNIKDQTKTFGRENFLFTQLKLITVMSNLYRLSRMKCIELSISFQDVQLKSNLLSLKRVKCIVLSISIQDF